MKLIMLNDPPQKPGTYKFREWAETDDVKVEVFETPVGLMGTFGEAAFLIKQWPINGTFTHCLEG